jgi:SAM-dependent methyltransferase
MRDKSAQPPWHGNVASNPELYDLLHQDNARDINLYKRMTRGFNRVLECGIGTGRVAIPLARSGRTVHGIDTSPEMLDYLRRKLHEQPSTVRSRIHLHHGDMCSFALGLSFPFVYVPFMTFNYLPDIAAQLACLRSIHGHMTPGGTLVIELMSFFPEWFYNDGIPRLIARRTDPNTGVAVEVFRITRFDASSQTMEHDRHYKFFDAQGRLECERVILLRNRFLFLGEALLLMEKARFSIRHVWGNHSAGPYNHHSQIMILVVTKNSST